ncbi:acetylcholinesterase collagenic tail peptide-like [Pseudochaenichthys georgianus]|uniref:acetylcholinesterase collagenic tail peptide-like n=1 Tax=Pseudochaenichthys georgianus TaxID=52239 RepID=UPI0039C36814
MLTQLVLGWTALLSGLQPAAASITTRLLSNRDSRGAAPKCQIFISPPPPPPVFPTVNRQEELMVDITELITGPTGDKGCRGPRGREGPPGVRGPEAEHGAQGAIGQPGPKGEKGDRGWRGLYGDIGTPGMIKGSKGGKGFRGEKGVRAKRGPAGDLVRKTCLSFAAAGNVPSINEFMKHSDDFLFRVSRAALQRQQRR